MKLYLFTQKGCVNCPAVKARLIEEGIDFKEVDAQHISVDFTMKLLQSNIVIYMTPALVKEEDGKYTKITLDDLVVNKK